MYPGKGSCGRCSYSPPPEAADSDCLRATYPAAALPGGPPDFGLRRRGVISYNQVALPRAKQPYRPKSARRIPGKQKALCLSAEKSSTTA